MGGSMSTKEITQEILEDYVQLSYLTKAEIIYLYKRFKTLGPAKLEADYTQRFPVREVLTIFPEIRHNPFRDSIMRVFSSEQDGCFSFEDTLDMCSVLSEGCPEHVRAEWAFRIFDFDGDNQISLDDLVEAVERLTGLNEENESRIGRRTAEYIAQVVLEEMDMDHTGCIAPQEFVHIVSRMPEFLHTFRFTV